MSLAGKRIVVTRASTQASTFARRLEECGALPLLYPCVEIQYASDYDVPENPDWIVFASQNAVCALAAKLNRENPPTPFFKGGNKIAAVGRETARAVQTVFGITPHIVPQRFDAASLAAVLPVRAGENVFLPQSHIGGDVLEEALVRKGAHITRVVAYQTLKGSGGIHFLSHLRDKQISAVTFASPSALRYFIERLNDEGASIEILKDISIACIGPTTYREAVKYNFKSIVTAKDHTTDGLIAALEEHFA